MYIVALVCIFTCSVWPSNVWIVIKNKQIRYTLLRLGLSVWINDQTPRVVAMASDPANVSIVHVTRLQICNGFIWVLFEVISDLFYFFIWSYWMLIVELKLPNHRILACNEWENKSYIFCLCAKKGTKSLESAKLKSLWLIKCDISNIDVTFKQMPIVMLFLVLPSIFVRSVFTLFIHTFTLNDVLNQYIIHWVWI